MHFDGLDAQVRLQREPGRIGPLDCGVGIYLSKGLAPVSQRPFGTASGQHPCYPNRAVWSSRLVASCRSLESFRAD